MGAKGDSRVAVAALVAALVLFGIGCAKKDSGKRAVVFWQFSPLTAIQPIVDRFNADNPDLAVQVEQLTWQSGREKIVAAIAAGRPPDLCELGSTFLPGLVADSTISRSQAKAVLLESMTEDKWPRTIVEERGLAQVSDAGELGAVVDTVFARESATVEQYRASTDDKDRKKKRNALMGQVMAQLKGKGNPQLVNQLLDERLS